MEKTTITLASLSFLLLITTGVSSQRLNEKWPVLKSYEGKYLDEIAMPLGGIGTGTVSIGGRGDLRDWELMNRGAIGYLPAFKLVNPTISNGPFFVIYTKTAGASDANIRVLEGPLPVREYYGDWGADAVNSGFPRFAQTSFHTAYPLAQVLFRDKRMPVDVRLETFNPLIPADEDKSGIPVAVLRYVVTNTSRAPVDISLCGMIPNYIGVDGWTGSPKDNKNIFRRTSNAQGIYMYSARKDSNDINWGTMALTTTATEGVSYRTSWRKLGWNWTFREFWDDLIADGLLTDHPDAVKGDEADAGVYGNKGEGKIETPPATVAVKQQLAPGESKSVTFLITWHFPNRRPWDNGFTQIANNGKDTIVGNYYSTVYRDAWDVVDKTVPELPSLENATVEFVKTFTDNDLPEVLKEAALFNLANLRCQTVFRTKDGLPYAWEGTGSIRGTRIGAERSSGWGFGTCTHVWNYETATPYVFGNLASKFREVEFLHATKADGGMDFRVPLPLGNNQSWGHRAADGQMGCIIKAYREWQLSGDQEKLKQLYPYVRSALSFAWKAGKWDLDADGIMEGSQHNTMDINYVGPNPQMGAWYLGALKAGQLMARFMKDEAFERTTGDLYTKGRNWMDAKMFNGEYYEQHIPDTASKVAQLGKGCLVDQLIGQNIAMSAGLGYILDSQHVRTTMKSIMKYNLVEDFNNHFNTFRSYGVGDEKGLIMASYPHGELLDFPFPYYTEIMTGFEYSAGSQMLYEGQTENGLKVYEAIRNRFDGYKRNPFNEGEYGHRYGRAMAAWTGLLAYTGFNYSAVNRTMTFNPRKGRYFWSNGYRYGTITVRESNGKMEVTLLSKNGDITLNSFYLNGFGAISFNKGKTFKAGSPGVFVIGVRG